MRFFLISLITIFFSNILISNSSDHRPYDEYNKKSNLELCLGDGKHLTIRNFDQARAARDENDQWIARKSVGYAFVAIERGLDERKCRKLIKENSTEDPELNNLNEDLNIEKKLKRLKNMLDQELISQEQYDDKSSKILEEF